MSKEELFQVIIMKEDLIISKERALEDEQIKFKNEKIKFEDEKKKFEYDEIKKFEDKMQKLEENIKLYNRSKEDIFLRKKREIENDKLELIIRKIIELYYNNKLK